MSAPVRKRGFLLNLAAEGMAPAVAGCATPPASETAIDRFGLHIVSRWLDWLNEQPLAARRAAIAELADLPAAKARLESVAALEAFASNSSIDDRARAVEYLCALPRFTQRALVLDPSTGAFALPSGIAPDDFRALLGMLPIDVPPHPPGSLLPDTGYLLRDLAGGSNTGTFYRATSEPASSTVRIECCTNSALVALLRHHSGRLKPPVPAERWSDRLVRLLASELDHPTPFLVWEQSSGGDLAMLLTNLKHQTGRGFAAEDVFRLIEQVVEGLAFAHALGMVHGDLKPANVLISGDTVKLADLGAGIATAAHAITHSQIGAKPFEQLRPSEQVAVLRGAASLLYLSPEQRRDETPDPRHDLFSLGVLWYQMLVGDVSRGLPPEWQAELAEKHHVPPDQIGHIERCVGPLQDRPRDGSALLALLRPQESRAKVVEQHGPSVVLPEELRRQRQRKEALFQGLKALRGGLREYRAQHSQAQTISARDVLSGLMVAIPVALIFAVLTREVLSILIALPLISLVMWIRLLRRRTKTAVNHATLRLQADRLAEDHPDEVQSWGGVAVLLNLDVLVEIIGAFEADLRTLSPEIEQGPAI